MIDVAILTEKRYLSNPHGDPYVNNILLEDGLIKVELEKINISCRRVAWDFDFKSDLFKCVLFRTTWNYFDEIINFKKFLTNNKHKTDFINPINQIVWNLDKVYLLQLHDRGINIPKTILVKKNSTTSLLDVVKKNKMKGVVIKPSVSAAAWKTYYIKESDLMSSEKLFQKLIGQQDMLIQDFQKNIIKHGEVSVMMIDGEYSHAVLKCAKPGDFRVQDDFGGSVNNYTPNMLEISFAKKVLNKLDFKPVYARVDIIIDNDNKIALSELELIEPEMWFRFNSSAAQKLARAIKKQLSFGD